MKKIYDLYKRFLREYRPYYNVFFLAQLFDLVKKHRFYNAEEIREKWQEHLQAVEDKEIFPDMNFYIHIPFCKFKCEYCMYYSKIEVAKNAEIEKYVNRLVKQMHFFKDVFSSSEFRSLYIGGGTPSLFTARQIDRLLGNLLSCFKFTDDGEKTYECNPLTTTKEKLKLMKKYGFNRVSFGVESLDKKVLCYANRDYQNYELIKRAVDNAKSFGLEVNLDLMTGLRGETIHSILESFVKAASLKPFSISIYPHKPSERYLNKHFAANYELYNANLLKKMNEVRRLFKAKAHKTNYYIDPVIDQGDEIYSLSEPTFYLKGYGPEGKYRYDFNRLQPCSLFSLGSTSCSFIFNSIRYKDISTGREGQEFNPRQRHYSVVEFDLKDEARYYVLQTLSWKWCISQKDFSNFFDFFKLDISSIFKENLNILKKLKKVRFKRNKIFLPRNPLERFICGLLFFDKKGVIKKINCFFAENILGLVINANEYLIQIKGLRNKRCYFRAGNFTFSFIEIGDDFKFSDLERQVIRSFCNLFKMIALQYRPQNAKEMKKLLFEHINTAITSQREELLRNGIELRVFIDNPLAKNEAHLF